MDVASRCRSRSPRAGTRQSSNVPTRSPAAVEVWWSKTIYRQRNVVERWLTGSDTPDTNILSCLWLACEEDRGPFRTPSGAQVGHLTLWSHHLRPLTAQPGTHQRVAVAAGPFSEIYSVEPRV